MVTSCHAAGVKGEFYGYNLTNLRYLEGAVIADTIFNHMSGGDGTDIAGNCKLFPSQTWGPTIHHVVTAYTHYNYPGYYEPQDFHYCNNGNDDNIENYDNRTEVQECQLDGLAE